LDTIFPLVWVPILAYLHLAVLVCLAVSVVKPLKPLSELGLIWGLIWGLIVGLIAGLIVGLISDITVGLIVGLIWGLISGLISGLINEFNPHPDS